MVGCSKENFDSYFTKLQNICTDNMNEDVKSNSAAAAAAAGLDGGKGQQVQQGDQTFFCVKGCVTEKPWLPLGFSPRVTNWVKIGLILHFSVQAMRQTEAIYKHKFYPTCYQP